MGPTNASAKKDPAPPGPAHCEGTPDPPAAAAPPPPPPALGLEFPPAPPEFP